jgi:hypothetical protein
MAKAMDTNLKSVRSTDAPKPSEAEVVKALVEIEQATQNAPRRSGDVPPKAAMPQSWLSRNVPMLSFVTLALAMILLISWLGQRAVKKFVSSHTRHAEETGSTSIHFSTDPDLQAELEGLLERVTAGDPGAADRAIARSSDWTGKTQRTPKTDQLITAGINLKNMRARAASLRAQLALDGVPIDESGFTMLERASGNPQQRTWALWMLGALGNRGVDPVHSAKIMEAYLSDPDVAVRTSAVEGLALLATDETIPMLLDRFRNDPSPAVQEQAACGMAEAGMYTHPQRMVAASSLVGWVDDALLSQQQRTWAAQALHDISGQNFGGDSTAWQRWLESSR